MPCNIGVSKNSTKLTGKQLRVFNKVFLKRKTPVQVFPCEFCKIFKNIFYRIPSRDCLCVLETVEFNRRTLTEEFNIICLSKPVIKTVLVAMNDLKNTKLQEYICRYSL